MAAVLATTTNTLLVWTANALAVLGLRSLYFCLAGPLRRFRYLHYGPAVLLAFAGVKLILSETPVGELPVPLALGVIAATTTVSIAWSLIATRGRNGTDTDAASSGDSEHGDRASAHQPPVSPAPPKRAPHGRAAVITPSPDGHQAATAPGPTHVHQTAAGPPCGEFCVWITRAAVPPRAVRPGTAGPDGTAEVSADLRPHPSEVPDPHDRREIHHPWHAPLAGATSVTAIGEGTADAPQRTEPPPRPEGERRPEAVGDPVGRPARTALGPPKGEAGQSAPASSSSTAARMDSSSVKARQPPKQ